LFVSRCLAATLVVACCLLPARAQQPPSPGVGGLPDGIAAEIAGLQAQIDSLRAEKADGNPRLPKARGADGVPGPHERPSMVLSGQVPIILQRALAGPAGVELLHGRSPSDYGVWAVHGGGRAILDAVETGIGLQEGALDRSREVLRECGNMSSATLMFVMQRLMADIGTSVPRGAPGFAVAFGPGLAAESFRFEAVGG
jgi:predicted naringenin-chalcone synthase